MDFHLAKIWTHILILISSVFFFTSLQNCQTHVMAAYLGQGQAVTPAIGWSRSRVHLASCKMRNLFVSRCLLIHRLCAL